MSRTGWLLAGAVVRAAWGTTLVVAPRALLALDDTPGVGTPTAVARTLGIRQLMQAGTTVVAPTRMVAGCGALVDALHASSDVGLAVASRRWRRAALTDALIATAFAAVGWSCYRR